MEANPFEEGRRYDDEEQVPVGHSEYDQRDHGYQPQYANQHDDEGFDRKAQIQQKRREYEEDLYGGYKEDPWGQDEDEDDEEEVRPKRGKAKPKKASKSARASAAAAAAAAKKRKKNQDYEEDDPETDKEDDGEAEAETQDMKEARLAMKEAATWLANEEKRTRKKNSRYD